MLASINSSFLEKAVCYLVLWDHPQSIYLPFIGQFRGLPCGSAGKESAYNAGDLGSIPGLGRSPGEGKGYPLQS